MVSSVMLLRLIMKTLSKVRLRKSLRVCALSTALTTLGGAVTLFFIASPAQAALFNFSYKFPNTELVTWKGTVSGTLLPDQNTVQISNGQSSFSSLLAEKATCPFPYPFPCNFETLFDIPLSNTLFTRFTLDGSQVVGRAGSLPDVLNGSGEFVLISTNFSNANDFREGGLGLSTPFSLLGIPRDSLPVTPGEQSPGLQPYDRLQWTAVEVPEPSTITGYILAGGGVMLKMLKRKKKKIRA